MPRGALKDNDTILIVVHFDLFLTSFRGPIGHFDIKTNQRAVHRWSEIETETIHTYYVKTVPDYPDLQPRPQRRFVSNQQSEVDHKDNRVESWPEAGMESCVQVEAGTCVVNEVLSFGSLRFAFGHINLVSCLSYHKKSCFLFVFALLQHTL